MRLTNKQHYVLDVIARRNDDGTAVDLDQLLHRLPWQPTKASTQFVIRALVNKKLIEKGECVHRREHKRRTFRPSGKGIAVCSVLGEASMERRMAEVDDSIIALA